MLRFSVILGVIVLAGFSLVSAGETIQTSSSDELILLDDYDLEQTSLTYKKLQYGYELWKDACLSRKITKTSNFHQRVLKIINHDIASSRERLRYYEKQSKWIQSSNDMTKTKNVGKESKLKTAYASTMAKEKIFLQLQRKDNFVNREQQLSKYFELLKNDLGIICVALTQENREN